MTAGVILDLDGTLIDTAPAILASFAAAFEAIGRAAPSPEHLRGTIGRGLPDVFAEACPGLPSAAMATAIQAFRDHFDGPAIDLYTVFPGSEDALEMLRGAGWRLGVVTGKPAPFASALVERAGLAPLLDRVMGVGLDERGWQASKTRLAAKTIRRFGLDPAGSWLVGDQPSDIAVAKSNALRSGAALWGYGQEAALRSAGPDLLLRSLKGFADYLVHERRAGVVTPRLRTAA